MLRPACIAFIALLNAPQVPVAPVPTITFQLQAQSAPPSTPWWSMKMQAVDPQAVIKAGPDGTSLFALVPQPDRRWEFQRLTEWTTGKPAIERLVFDGDDSKDASDYIQAEMTPTPDGEHLLVRILALKLAGTEYQRHTALILIDLKGFRVVWRRLSDDPLLADSRISFTDPNTFVSVQGPAPMKRLKGHLREFVPDDVLVRNPVSLGIHQAGLYSLKDLTAVMPACSYEVTTAPEITVAPPVHQGAQTGVLPNEDDSILDYQEPQVIAKAISQSCEPLLRAVHATSIEHLPGVREASYHLGRNGWPGCDLDERSAVLSLSVYDCRSGEMNEHAVFQTSKQDERLAALDWGPSLLRVPLRRFERYSATLANVDGHPALILLRSNMRVEVYVWIKPRS